jgi:hypothetical protein
MEINQYAVTASEMKDLSFLDIDQYVSAGVYQSQKVPVSLVKAYMLSENIEQILLADMQALALAGDLVSLKNYLIDDGSTLYLVMAAGGVGNQIYQYAIDVTSGLFGTFDLVSGVFTVAAPTIQQVLDAGDTSTTPIIIDDGAGNSVSIGTDLIKFINTTAGGTAQIKSSALTSNTVFEIPNKAAGTETFAMLSDVVAGSGTVTSVGLSMPSAFSVASSPVTTSGTIAVTGAGLSSQYVRGDGSLANFPSSGGGGASVNYYLNGSVSQGTFGGVAMREINKTPIIGTGTDFTIAANGYIQSFITDANDPNQLVIPAGNWNFETYFSASSGGGSPSFYIELHKWDGTTLTLIASNSATPEAITGGTTIDLYLSAIAVPQTTLALTDRLAIRIYVNNSSRTITLHTENSHLCQVITTFTTGLTALNGLTEQVQNLAVGTSGTDFAISSASSTHTFNLPTASASNRGALSSADWTAFNGKMTNPMTTGGDIIYGGSSGAPTRLANGTAGQILQSNGTTLAPSWVAAPSDGTNTYSVNVQSFSLLAPVDATSYHFGIIGDIMATTTLRREFKFPQAGTMTAFSFNLLQSTNGSNETCTLYLRNTTTSTDYTIGTFTSDFGLNGALKTLYSGLSIAVNTTDNWVVKILTPTWGTNPANWGTNGLILITT